MAETREQRKAILDSAVEQFLDHLEAEYSDEEDQLGSVVICAEVYSDDAVVPTYYSSNENGIWRRGLFSLLADYHTVNLRPEDHDDE